MDLQMLQYKATETEIARELFDQIRESHRAHLPGGRDESLRVSVPRNRDTRKAGSAAASHEWEAVHEVFRASRPKFIRLACSILRNKEDAEDAVQDAMLSAYRHLRSFKGRSAFTTWFTRIVFNAAFMIRRKRKPERIGSFPDSGETDETPWVERIPAAQPDPEMVCAEAETFRAIDELLRKMSPVLRQAFTMAYYDEMSVEEAGAPPHPPGTFKARVFRARQHLIRQTQHSLVVPIRRAQHTLFSSNTRSFAASAAGRAEISSSEVALG
jgi:RNA polymerase sigma-70 factor (ECF subfamily)